MDAAAERLQAFRALLADARERLGLPIGFVLWDGSTVPADLAALFERAMLRATEEPEHAELLRRLNLAPWRRDAAAYRAHVEELFRTMPPLMRAVGMQPI